MDYATAVKALDRTTSETISRRFPGRLDRMLTLLRHIGDPQHSFLSIHVGGSAGKGSTASMCATRSHRCCSAGPERRGSSAVGSRWRRTHPR